MTGMIIYQNLVSYAKCHVSNIVDNIILLKLIRFCCFLIGLHNYTKILNIWIEFNTYFYFKTLYVIWTSFDR